MHRDELSKSEPSIHHVEPTSSASQLYRHTFFSREVVAARKSIFPTVILPIIYNGILMWACLSLFFGSLLKNNDVSKIKVTAVNSDNDFLGLSIVSNIQRSLEMPGPHLRWSFEDGIGNGDERSRELVLQEKTWAVLQISSNATSSFLNALEQGDASYNPLSAVTLYFTSARNQVTTLALAVPAILNLVNPILSRIAVNSTATLLQTATSSNNSTALSTALKCPQCLASPFAIKSVDLIPFAPAQAFGALNTGIIFLLTFTFNILTVLHAGATVHGSLFTLRTQLYIRSLSSLLAYLFLSLTYTLIILAFSVPLTGNFPQSRASGFFVLWMLNWCTMGACGLLLETIITIVGMAWAAFALNAWLIANVSSSFASFEVMVGFFEYGYAMPFYHCIQATRTIMFGTQSHLGLNFGVLIAWNVVGLAGICIATTWRVRKGLRTGVHVVP